jgi:hypothetical protein
MMPHHVYDHQALLGRLWLYILLHLLWPGRGAWSPQAVAGRAPWQMCKAPSGYASARGREPHTGAPYSVGRVCPAVQELSPLLVFLVPEREEAFFWGIAGGKRHARI